MLKGMNFKRQDILDALKKNRDIHLTIVRESQEGFREKLIAEFGKKLKRLKEGREVDPRTKHSLPPNHTDDYDRAIQMLEMCQDDTVELDEKAFQAYVRNKWSWEDHFLVANSAYSDTARDLNTAR